jgi:hypothetical protein
LIAIGLEPKESLKRPGNRAGYFTHESCARIVYSVAFETAKLLPGFGSDFRDNEPVSRRIAVARLISIVSVLPRCGLPYQKA